MLYIYVDNYVASPILLLWMWYIRTEVLIDSCNVAQYTAYKKNSKKTIKQGCSNLKHIVMIWLLYLFLLVYKPYVAFSSRTIYAAPIFFLDFPWDYSVYRKDLEKRDGRNMIVFDIPNNTFCPIYQNLRPADSLAELVRSLAQRYGPGVSH